MKKEKEYVTTKTNVLRQLAKIINEEFWMYSDEFSGEFNRKTKKFILKYGKNKLIVSIKDNKKINPIEYLRTDFYNSAIKSTKKRKNIKFNVINYDDGEPIFEIVYKSRDIRIGLGKNDDGEMGILCFGAGFGFL